MRLEARNYIAEWGRGGEGGFHYRPGNSPRWLSSGRYACAAGQDTQKLCRPFGPLTASGRIRPVWPLNQCRSCFSGAGQPCKVLVAPSHHGSRSGWAVTGDDLASSGNEGRPMLDHFKTIQARIDKATVQPSSRRPRSRTSSRARMGRAQGWSSSAVSARWACSSTPAAARTPPRGDSR